LASYPNREHSHVDVLFISLEMEGKHNISFSAPLKSLRWHCRAIHNSGNSRVAFACSLKRRARGGLMMAIEWEMFCPLRHERKANAAELSVMSGQPSTGSSLLDYLQSASAVLCPEEELANVINKPHRFLSPFSVRLLDFHSAPMALMNNLCDSTSECGEGKGQKAVLNLFSGL
jgi:hypothetical protein